MYRKCKKISYRLLRKAFPWICVAATSTGMCLGQTPKNAKEEAQIQKGRETVGEVCVACHTNILRMVQIHKESPEEWKDTVYSMVARGAQLTPDEIGSVTAYLANVGSKRAVTSIGEAVVPGGRAAAGQQGRELDGRAIFQHTCQQCHDQATATAKLPNEDWSAVVTRMTGYGAHLSPSDQQKLVEYLEGLAK